MPRRLPGLRRRSPAAAIRIDCRNAFKGTAAECALLLDLKQGLLKTGRQFDLAVDGTVFWCVKKRVSTRWSTHWIAIGNFALSSPVKFRSCSHRSRFQTTPAKFKSRLRDVMILKSDESI